MAKLSIKLRIILIFSMLTMLLTAGMARLSYSFVKDIYLRQVEEQMQRFSQLIAGQIDLKYLSFIEAGTDNLARQQYRKLLAGQSDKLQLANVFLFDDHFNVLVDTREGISSERLLLHRQEISRLAIQAAASSLPFKGNDAQWYLWGFYRLDEHLFLGIQESAAKLTLLDRLSWIFFGIGMAGILLTIFAGWFSARWIARPIERLARFSSEIGQGHFKTAPPDKIHGELAALRDALISMRDSLLKNQEEKEKMLAQIAHEIRNPLGGIELLAGLVKESIEPDGLNDQYLQKILDEIHGLKEQITAYLNYSRPMPAAPEEINLITLFSEIQSILEPRLRQSNIHLEMKNGPGVICFDRQHLRQILINLISNSIEAMPNGGNIWLNADGEKGQSIISIRDEGSGIAREYQQKIFEPFFTTRPDGAGLGLAICKKLCEENGALIQFENHKERGCTFVITRSVVRDT